MQLLRKTFCSVEYSTVRGFWLVEEEFMELVDRSADCDGVVRGGCLYLNNNNLYLCI